MNAKPGVLKPRRPSRLQHAVLQNGWVIAVLITLGNWIVMRNQALFDYRLFEPVCFWTILVLLFAVSPLGGLVSLRGRLSAFPLTLLFWLLALSALPLCLWLDQTGLALQAVDETVDFSRGRPLWSWYLQLSRLTLLLAWPYLLLIDYPRLRRLTRRVRYYLPPEPADPLRQHPA